MIVGLAIGLALVIQAFVVKPFQIPSGSMEPTLDIGQRVLVNRFLYHVEDPEIGDIVVFHPPAGTEPGSGQECGVEHGPDQACPESTPDMSSENFIKRIVAGPGDQLYIHNGHPVVKHQGESDFVEAEEDFIRPCEGISECELKDVITIPPDHYFMMGDNRGASDDSRSFGPIPRDWIIGQAFATYWPPDRVGIF